TDMSLLLPSCCRSEHEDEHGDRPRAMSRRTGRGIVVLRRVARVGHRLTSDVQLQLGGAMRSEPDAVPEAVHDLKQALKRMVSRRFPSLRRLAEAASMSPDTASRAINGPDVPTPSTYRKIWIACGKPGLDDGRYDHDWEKLYRAANASAKAYARRENRT